MAPGTTTLIIGRGGAPTLLGRNTQQDPGVIVRNAYGQLMGPDSPDAKPTDFDLSKVYGYTPVHRGWIAGKRSSTSDLGACCSSCAAKELGASPETADAISSLDSEQQKAIIEVVMKQLELESKSLEIKERRSRRFWGAIAGIATGTTALVAVLSYMAKE